MSTSDENLYRGDPPQHARPADQPTTQPDQGSQPQYGQPQYGQPQYGQPQYGQPQYGQPQYGQPYGAPGYGPPPGYPPYAYGRPTNTLAILALVMAFVFAPAGLILGIVARKQVRRTGEDGDGLALAAIITGGIFTAIYVLFIVFWIVAVVSISNDGTF